MQLVCFSLAKFTNSWKEKNSRLSAATTSKSSSMWSLSIAYNKSHTAPRRVSLVSVPSSTMLIGLLQCKSFFQSSKMLANLWFVMIICSSISGILSISSSILPKIVFSPIFNNGFGKFLVKSPNLVAYPAAITIFFTPLFFNILISQLSCDKPRPIIGFHPIHLERVGIFGILLQILLRKLFLYLLLVLRINKCYDGTLESRT